MSGYPVTTLESAGHELNRLHGEIGMKLRSTVTDAIRAGEILEQVKSRVSQGTFLTWIAANCQFTNKTAEKYMALHSHSSKIESSSNLQEAYNQIETIEAQERMTEDKKARERVTAFVKTGKKPEGWRRGTDDKLAQEEKERAKRIEQMQDEIREEDKDRNKNAWASKINLAEINKMVAEHTQAVMKRVTFKEKIRISHEGKDDPFVDAIMDYLDTLDDDNRRVEACYNIIKVCKGIAVQIQQGVSA